MPTLRFAVRFSSRRFGKITRIRIAVFMARMRTPEEAELIVLRALCQAVPQGPLRAEAARSLAHYAWREPVHHAIFACLASLPAVEPNALRRTLIACLTRRGFPDVDLDSLFEPASLTHEQIERLMQRLQTSDPA